jgi:peptidyl-prolyl cis-trans isomerase SurA
MKKTCLIALAALLCSGIVNAQKIKYSDGIIAIVDDEVITVYDVALFVSGQERELVKDPAHQSEEGRKVLVEKMNDLRKRGAHRLIDNMLLFAEFKENGFVVPSEMIDKRIDRMVKRDADGDYGKFEDLLENQDQNLADLRESVSRRLAVQLLINQEINSKIKISPSQIKAYYDANQGEFSKPRAMKLRMIEVHSAGKSDADYKTLVATVSKKLSDGDDFDKVADAHSDHSKKASGGDVVWMKAEDLNTTLRAGLPSLEKGTTSKAVELGGNTYFLHIRDAQGGDVVPLEDVQQRLSNFLFDKEKQKRLITYIDSLRDKAYIRVFFKDEG